MDANIIYWNVDPVIFWITDTFPLKYYGLFFTIGLLLAFHIVKKIYTKERIPIEHLDSLFIYIVMGTIVGARLGHCLFYSPEYYLNRPLEIFLPIVYINGSYGFIGYQGLASHGGALGVLIAIIWYSKKYKTKLLWILDRIAIGAPVTGAFIRFGNFMNSEIYGKPTNGNWGVVFQRDDLILRHPTQLYEATAYLLIFSVLIWIYKSKKTINDGFIFGIFLVLLFLARFIIEFFKENQVGFEDELILNMGQLLSLPFILAGLITLYLNRKSRP
ncbi:prolipoprotein diacylglyceryl transferase [Anditalea andensis]|uniref:Phosphatidylglycerol--prolipoprotein diacylglyceryl transferase n=1 Tax=Anditalea andensis TaxID=1048983 RepID=A0A074L433_9BACT|nr:prolipoprotein diacylglyceryl transferase [Anditalea andensis]KEO75215.1 prolipoprotein diacylglyceryl transferase [Anditalea andensis]